LSGLRFEIRNTEQQSEKKVQNKLIKIVFFRKSNREQISASILSLPLPNSSLPIDYSCVWFALRLAPHAVTRAPLQNVISKATQKKNIIILIAFF